MLYLPHLVFALQTFSVIIVFQYWQDSNGPGQLRPNLEQELSVRFILILTGQTCL